MLPGNIQGLLYVIYFCGGILALYGIGYGIYLVCKKPDENQENNENQENLLS